MNETEKKAAIKKLQQEIDKRCSFFRIISDAGLKHNHNIKKTK